MADLITTDEEKAAASYLEWDDAAVGRFAKHVALWLESHKNDATGLHKVTTASCAMLLVAAAVESNATTLTLALEGHTHGETETGDWLITVRRTSEPSP